MDGAILSPASQFSPALKTFCGFLRTAHLETDFQPSAPHTSTMRSACGAHQSNITLQHFGLSSKIGFEMCDSFSEEIGLLKKRSIFPTINYPKYNSIPQNNAKKKLHFLGSSFHFLASRNYTYYLINIFTMALAVQKL